MIESHSDGEIVELLHRAEHLVQVRHGSDDRLASAMSEMIGIAAEMAAALQGRDLESARRALGHARATVNTATYAVRALHDDLRTGSCTW